MQSVSAIKEETQAPTHLTETIVDKLNNPSTSSDSDLHAGVNQLLADIGMSAADSGGQLTFYGQGGKLYWTDREGMRVMRANLDGSKIETLVDTSHGDLRPGSMDGRRCSFAGGKMARM
jgi:hypothetical protein